MQYDANKKILMIAALGLGDDGMSFASCRLRDEWQENGVPLHIVDFFDNGGSGVGVSAANKIRATFINKALAKKHIIDCDAVYFTPKLSPLGFISLISYYKMCLKHNKPYTLHIHGRALIDTYKNHKWIRKYIKKYVGLAKCTIALTNKLKEEMHTLFGCGNFDVVGNFAQDSIMLKENDFDKKTTVIKKKPMQICYMSNVIESKGIFDLIDAIGSDENFVLKVAGRIFPNEKNRFEKCLQEHSNVEYIGFVSDEQKKELLMESAVFCLPTRYPTEAQPIALIEALCMGCIIVATDLPGIVDTLGENYPKELFVEKDAEEIKSVLGAIYQSPENFYDRIHQNLKEYQAEFSLKSFAEKIYGCVIDD